MKEKMEDFNAEASKMMAAIVFVAVPVASLLRLNAKPLWSFALSMFHRQYWDDVESTNMEEVKKDGGLELECVICLCRVSPGDKQRILIPCNHAFHVRCINAWFQAHSTCPICRSSVTPLSPHQQHFYDGLVSCFLSPYKELCEWMDRPFVGCI